MTKIRLGLVVVGLAPLMFLWGCAQEPKGQEKQPTGEWSTKITRLQEEVRSLTAARDQLANDLKEIQKHKEKLTKDLQSAQGYLSGLQAENVQLSQRLEKMRQERDGLQEQIQTRTEERDSAVAQVEMIRTGVRTLLEQVETAANTLPRPLAAHAQPAETGLTLPPAPTP